MIQKYKLKFNVADGKAVMEIVESDWQLSVGKETYATRSVDAALLNAGKINEE
jgi:hypothetical protein